MLCARFQVNSAVIKKYRFHIKKLSYSSLSQEKAWKPGYSKEPGYQSVADFYKGKSVFLTGGTGFLGKVVIEKLLYSCANLDKVYMVIRFKKGENINERVKKMFDDPLYARLKKNNPNFQEKIVPIRGDFDKPDLGISAKDEDILINNVSVVFHMGATLNLNDKLSRTIKNFEASKYILNLCHRIKNVQAFVNVSTAFAHTQNKTLTETVYPSPAKLEDVYKFIAYRDDDQKALRKFLNGRPNAYVFCKALSEAYVAENCNDLPTVIVRPSVITAIKGDPIKGWVDNNDQLFLAIMEGIAMGWSRVLYGKGTNVFDLIPVDYVANLIIVAATRARTKELQVFNSTTSAENPVEFLQFTDTFIEQTVKYNRNTLPFPTVYYCNSKPMVKLFSLVFQRAPAQIADLWLRLRGKKPRCVTIMKNAIDLRKVADDFSSKVCDMKAGQTCALYHSLSAEDKKAFPFDPAEIDWQQYLKDLWKWNMKNVSSLVASPFSSSSR